MRSLKTVTVVGCHAEGEVGRVVTGGVLAPPGRTVFERMQHFREHQDDLRKFLLYVSAVHTKGTARRREQQHLQGTAIGEAGLL
jgi:proline racemase